MGGVRVVTEDGGRTSMKWMLKKVEDETLIEEEDELFGNVECVVPARRRLEVEREFP